MDNTISTLHQPAIIVDLCQQLSNALTRARHNRTNKKQI